MIRALMMLAICCLCAITACAGKSKSPVPLRFLTADPEAYAGKLVIAIACLNATSHTMTLQDCEDSKPQVDFEKMPGYEQSYLQLTQYGQENMGIKAQELPIQVIGIFHWHAEGAVKVMTIQLKDVELIGKIGT